MLFTGVTTLVTVFASITSACPPGGKGLISPLNQQQDCRIDGEFDAEISTGGALGVFDKDCKMIDAVHWTGASGWLDTIKYQESSPTRYVRFKMLSGALSRTDERPMLSSDDNNMQVWDDDKEIEGAEIEMDYFGNRAGQLGPHLVPRMPLQR